MIIVRCLFLMLFATCFHGSDALAADFAAPLASHNFFTPELKPSPDAFKLAKSTFLPETYDDLGLSGRHNTKYDFNKNDCSAYPLSSCPSNGKCTKCPVGAGWKLDSCNSGYTKTGDTCTKKAEFCVENATTFKNRIPDDYFCTKVTNNPNCSNNPLTNCDKCYTSCYKINCSGYPLDCKTINKAALHIATTEICSSCRNSTTSNCTKTYCKITECESGYKANAAGTACIEKDDTCPNGYYKSCETGTQGSPEYTEKGTACYQCKPKTTENMKVVVNFAKSCPAGLSFKMTPQGGSAVTCSSSQCYEYDVSNYPYAPDGIHSNETESIVTAGTQINLSSIPSTVSDIKSVSKKQTYSVSGTTYSFNVNDRATVIAGVGQNTDSGLGAYDFWTLQCDSGLAMLGDILYSDMTTGRPENHAASGKKAIGVVVYDGLALALNKSPSTLQWGNGDGASKHNPYLITCTDPSRCKTSGKQATDNILKYGAENNYSFPAAEYCNDYIVPGTSAGAWWHLPSIAELNSATYSSTSDARRVVNDTLSLVGGQILGDDEAYWTSDEAQASGAYMLLGASKWTKPYTTTESLKSRWFSHGKYESAYVRPFINYKVTYTPLPVLYSDMTTAYEIIEDKDPIGVVFDETRRLAVALDETAFEWSALQPDTDISTDSPLTDFNGAANTEYYWNNICKKRQVACPPFYYVKNYNVIRSDWYLPAYGELNEIYNKKTDINETMSLLNATPLSSGRYWSSSQTTGELGMYLLYMPYGQRLYSDEFGGASVARAVINY